MAAEELWTNLAGLGQPFLETNQLMPQEILLTQANALEKGTKQAIKGIVELYDSDGLFDCEFILYVPELSGYKYVLLEVSHGPQLYPLKLEDYTNSQVYECQSEEEFIENLKTVLNSPGVTKVLRNLLRLRELQVQKQDEDLS